MRTRLELDSLLGSQFEQKATASFQDIRHGLHNMHALENTWLDTIYYIILLSCFLFGIK